jgi:hypothetical protein
MLLLAGAPAWAMIFEGENAFDRRYGFMHVNGPGQTFNEGDTLTFVVTNPETLARVVGIKGLNAREHILLQHIKGEQFEVRHEASKQKVPLRLAVKK